MGVPNRPTVCVALPVKDIEAHICETMDSVLAQEGVDLTVRVVDNRSSDDTVAIAQRYAAADPRVTVAVNPVDVGYYGSLNRALAETDATYYVPFAADDVMAPGNLARKVAALEEHGAGLAHSSTRRIDSAGATIDVCPDHRAVPAVVPAPNYFAQLVPLNAIACQSVMVRTELLRGIGGFDARSHYAADWYTWLRLALRCTVVTFAEPLVSVRIHTDTGTTRLRSTGINSRDVPSTLEHAFADPALPAAWAPMSAGLVAECHLVAARDVAESGVHRIADGWPAYVAAGRALALVPGDPRMRAAWTEHVAAAGLRVPRFPLRAVAHAPRDAAGAAQLAATAEALGPLLAGLTLACDGAELDAAMVLLEPVFGDAALDVAVVPDVADADLLAAGDVTLAPWGADLVAASEAADVPVLPYAIPRPFDNPPDPAMWETVEQAAQAVGVLQAA